MDDDVEEEGGRGGGGGGCDRGGQTYCFKKNWDDRRWMVWGGACVL